MGTALFRPLCAAVAIAVALAAAGQDALSDREVAAAIALGQQGADLRVRVGAFMVRKSACSVSMVGPMARISEAAAAAAREYRPFNEGSVTRAMRARTYVVSVRDEGALLCGVRHIVLQAAGAIGLEDAIQPIQENASGSTFAELPPGDFQVVVAIAVGGAQKLRVSAKERAKLDESDLEPPPPMRLPLAAVAPAGRDVRLFVTGDSKHVADAIAALRAELQAGGVRVLLVQPSAQYDYRIVLAEGDRNAGAAVALDAQGNVVAVIVRGAFTEKGAAEASARDLAKKLAALTK
jgi:hypothetical protein